MLKRILSGVLLCALLIALLPSFVFASNQEAYILLDTWTSDIPQRNAALLPEMSLAEGNHPQWIDRIGQRPDFADSFYAWLEDNATPSGALADPTKGTYTSGNYVYIVETIKGTAHYTDYTAANAKEKASQAVTEDLGDLPNQIVAYAAAVYGAFDRDHCEVFWLSGSSTYGCATSFSYGGGVVNYTANVYFYLKKANFDLRKAEYQSVSAIEEGCQLRDRRIAEILADCTAESDADKILYLNDVLTKTNAYNSAVGSGNVSGAAGDAWECISALEGNTGTEGPVCEGYARALKLLCQELDIPCVLAEGSAVVSANGTPGGHMWNLVQVDGAWYAVDVTWNDPYVSTKDVPVSGYESTEFALLGSQTMCSIGLTFAQSHTEANKTTTESLSYINGPVLSQEAYVFPPTVVAPSITLSHPTLLLEDEIILSFYFSLDQTDFDVSQLGLLTWEQQPANVDVATADAVIWGAEYDAAQGLYRVSTAGIPAQELGDDIYFCVFAKLSDGSYAYGKQVSYCPKTYAYNQLSKSSVSVENKALYVAMLNYGAAAQVYLDYRTDALINADLSEELKALVEDFRQDMVQAVTMPDSEKQGALVKTASGFADKKPTVSLDCAFSINYYLTTNETVAGDVIFYCWDQAAFAEAQTLSPDNATDCFTLTGEDGRYSATVAGIAAKDINSPLYVCAVYADDAGNQYSTGILPYSLGFYCGNQAVSGSDEMRPIAQAIGVYGFYAMAYFA